MDVTISDFAWIDKSTISDSAIDKLKKKLTLTPHKTHRLQEDPEKILLYSDDEKRFGIPRSYFRENRRFEHVVHPAISVGHPVNLSFSGELINDQSDAVDCILRDRQSGSYGGILQAGPGWGKTTASLYIVTRIGLSTIVIVNREFLLEQWYRRIKGVEVDGVMVRKGFIPDARVGIIQGDRFEYGKDYDICIAMIQTVANRKDEYPKEFWESFGLAITDECHRIGAPTWNSIATSFPVSYRLGLTATPRRKDGAENVFFHHIGPIVYKSNVVRLKPKLRRVFTKFILVKRQSFDPNKAGKETMLRFLCADKGRNELIVNELKQACERGRKVAVLSERRNHLNYLSDAFQQETSGKYTTAFYVGGMKSKERDAAEGAQVIFCTYQMTAEALDIPSLDTVFFTTPMSDVEQATGRIQRPFPDKMSPVITDFIDEGVPYFARLWEKRLEFYSREGMYKP